MNKNSNHNLAIPIEQGKAYHFAGYEWTACEVDKTHNAAVLQSHGVTAGVWPGYKMLQFGNGDYYADSIDGQDISAYDDKTQALYDAIKNVEDKSASYGKGLYLISKEKVCFTEWGKPGFGNHWKALKEAAVNYSSFKASNYYCAWLGTVYDSTYAWCVNRYGNIYSSSGQGDHDFVITPAFNLDLSKVEVVGDEIVVKGKVQGNWKINQKIDSHIILC